LKKAKTDSSLEVRIHI